MREILNAFICDRTALSVDDGKLAAPLPQGERLALAHLDADRVRQKPRHRRRAHPVEPLDPLPRRFRVEAENRIAALRADGGKEIVFPRLRAARHRHVLNAEAGQREQAVRLMRNGIDAVFRMAADQHAVDGDAGDQRERAPGERLHAEIAFAHPLDPHADGPGGPLRAAAEAAVRGAVAALARRDLRALLARRRANARARHFLYLSHDASSTIQLTSSP